MLKKSAWFFYILLLTLLAVFASSFLFFIVIKYDQFISFILKEIHREDLYHIITQTYFTEEKFSWIKNGSIVFSAFSGIILLLAIKTKDKILSKIFYLESVLIQKFESLIMTFQRLEKNVKAALAVCLLIIITRSFYFANTFYIQYDEAWNYNYFLAHNPVYTVFAYNNYPLHNLVSSIFLSFLPANTLVLRLPSILIGIFSCLFVFAIIQKIWNNAMLSLCAMCLFACLPITVFYMMYARGVIFELFFSWLITYFIYQFFKSETTLKDILFLGMLNALGVYCMLSHLYFITFSFLAILIFVLMTNQSKWKYAVYYFIVSILCSSILIFPFLLGTGVSLGANAAKSSQNLLTLHILPFHAYSDMMGGAWFVFYLLLVTNVFLLFKEKNKRFLLLILLNLALLLSPLLIYILSNTFPPERAFAFIAIATIMTFALAIQYFKIKSFPLSITTILVVVILSISTYKHDALNWSKEMDKEAYVMFQLFDKNEISNVYSESENFKYYVPSLIYYFSLKKKEFHYRTNEKSSTRYTEHIPSNTECIVRSAKLAEAKSVYQFDGMYFYFLK